jgi:hypothetical protein
MRCIYRETRTRIRYGNRCLVSVCISQNVMYQAGCDFQDDFMEIKTPTVCEDCAYRRWEYVVNEDSAK